MRASVRKLPPHTDSQQAKSKVKTINIVGDIAGRFDELMELLAKMPAADLVLSVGDMIDRGPDSKKVIDWFMGDPAGRDAVLANHEVMMLDAYYNYATFNQTHPFWGMNGGRACLDSFGGWGGVSHNVLFWMATRPLWYKQDGLFVSHAPVWDYSRIPQQYGVQWQQFTDDESSWVWNRYLNPRPMPDHFMVYGHNSSHKEHWAPLINQAGDLVDPNYHYASCIDNSRKRELMGMHWPTKELFTTEYHETERSAEGNLSVY